MTGTRIDALDALPTDTFLEVAGRLKAIRLRMEDDPFEVAQAHTASRPWETRFRLVTMTRFTVEEDRPICGSAGTTEDGSGVKCSSEPHNEGVDHAGKVIRDGQRVGVHYWRERPAIAP
ncbi:hypothetical protein [Streptomyces alanosinicus]|uniref:Uncharacterized protein n=1 Tax=Streptomyces alanosinicus TaxID=68171 RepID=A0A918YFQ1_9ACTN|nr:hypothetical protein [Streptomyces alanosinicus]GHE01594.1 hypothetical protein GCM10010339_21610 [Streptomyces alanosinicus]